MATLVAIEGFETGALPENPRGTPTVVTTSPRSGTYCLEVSGSDEAMATIPLGGVSTVLVASFGLYVADDPGGPTTIVQAFGSDPGGSTDIQFTMDGGDIYVAVNGQFPAYGPTLTTGVWHRIDFLYDGTTDTLDWSVNGAPQDAATGSGYVTGLENLWIGADGGGFYSSTLRFDDVLVSQTSGDYPLPDHKVVGLLVDPSGTLTVSGSTANFNTFTSNGTLAAWNATTARNNIDERPPTIGASSDGLVQVTTSATSYVEIPMTSYTLTAGETVMGGRMVAFGWATNANACTIGFRSYNGTTETDLFPAANPFFDNASANPLPVMLTLADINTQAEIDALAFRVGFSTDAAPDVGIHAIYAELAIEVPDLAGTATKVNLYRQMRRRA